MLTKEWKEVFQTVSSEGALSTNCAKEILREIFPGSEKPLNAGGDNRRNPVYPSHVYNLGRALMAYVELLHERK